MKNAMYRNSILISQVGLHLLDILHSSENDGC